jgi:hypothetical protein
MTESIIFKKEYDLIRNKLLKSLVFIRNIREQNIQNKYKKPELYFDIDITYMHNIQYCLYKFLEKFIENENKKADVNENEKYSYYELKIFMYKLNEKLSQNLNYITKNSNTYLFIQSELKKLPLSSRIQLHNMFIKYFQVSLYIDFDFDINSENKSVKLN